MRSLFWRKGVFAVNIGKKRVGIVLLSVLCAVCILFGWALSNKSLTVKAEPSVTVEDLYDVTQRDGTPKAFFDGISNPATFSGFQSSVAENYEFTARMALSFEYNKEFVFGLMANGIGGHGSYDGYWFVMNEVSNLSDTSGRTLKLFTKKQFFDNQVLTKTNENGALNSLWEQMLSKDGFDFAMGVQSKIDQANTSYTYVYVKVNGSVVFEYDNYNADNVSYGKYIYADSYNRATIYANKDLVKSNVTVEDIADVTNGATSFDGISKLQDGFAPMGTSSVNKNFEFTSTVLFKPANETKNLLPIGILCGGTNTASDGYWFSINKTDNTVNLYSGCEGNPHNLVKTKTAPDVVYSPSGFTLSFGVVEVSRGEIKAWNYVYVKINGELLFEYADIKYQNRTALGVNVLADTHSRASFFVVLNEENAVAGNVTYVDLYDVWGELERGSGAPYHVKLGETGVNKNLVFTTKVFLSAGHLEAPIGILVNAEDTCGSAGYWFVVNETDGVHLVRGIYGSGNRADIMIVQSLPKMDELYSSNGFVLEFGAVTYTYEGQFVYTLVTAKVNGETVFEYKDYVEMECGDRIVVDSYLRCSLRTAKEGLTFASAQVADWYDLSGEITTLYNHTTDNASGGLEYTMGNLPRNKNVAFKANVTFGDVDYDAEHSRNIWFLKATDVMFDHGTGYYFEWNSSVIRLGAYVPNENGYPVKRIGVEGTTPQAIAPNNTVLLELGSVAMSLNGTYLADYIYVKIDGEEVLSMIDENPFPDNGTFVMSPYGSSIGQWERFSSTRDFVTFTCNDERVQMRELTVFSDVDYALNIPVSVGYKTTSVFIDGASVPFNLVEGGAKVQLLQGFSGGEIEITAELFEIDVSVVGLENNAYTLDGVTNGKMAYGANASISFRQQTGKTLSFVKVNGVDCMQRVAVSGNTYSLDLYSLIVNTTIEIAFEDAQYSVTAVATENGQIVLSQSSVVAGGSISVTATPNDGYRLKGVFVNGKAVSVDDKGNVIIENIQENLEISAEFEKYEQADTNANNGCSGNVSLQTLGVTLALAICALLVVRRKRND